MKNRLDKKIRIPISHNKCQTTDKIISSVNRNLLTRKSKINRYSVHFVSVVQKSTRCLTTACPLIHPVA